MIDSISNSSLTPWKDAAGIAGNIFALGLFVSPIPTFRRILRNQSTEHFSGLPYIYSLLNCLICMWYGTPLVSADNVMVMTVNSFGAVFQLVYIIIFIVYANKAIKVCCPFILIFQPVIGTFMLYIVSHFDHSIQIRMFGLLLAVFGLFAIMLVGSLQITDTKMRWMFVGFLSCASLISMFASPLFIINLVIQTASVEFMPFCLSLSTFLMSTSFFLYGILNVDAFVYVPNGIGTILGITQLGLYFYYKNKSIDEFREPMIEHRPM